LSLTASPTRRSSDLLGYAASYPEPVSWPRALTGMAGLAVVLAYAVRTGRPLPFFLLALCGYPLLHSALFRIEDRGGVGVSLFWRSVEHTSELQSRFG